MKFFARIIISGIDVGEVELSENDTLEIIPVDCFFGYQSPPSTEEHRGLSSDGVCIRAYKDIDGAIAQEVHADLSSPLVPKLLEAIEKDNALYAGVQYDDCMPACNTLQPGVQQETLHADVQEIKDVVLPHATILPPEVKQLISEGRLSVGTKGLKKKQEENPAVEDQSEVVMKEKKEKERTKEKERKEINTKINNKKDIYSNEYSSGPDSVQKEDGPAAKPKSRRQRKPSGPVPAEIISASQCGQIPKSMIDSTYRILGKDIPDSAIRIMIESFVDYHLKKGNLWVDWMAVWREWLRHQKRFAAEKLVTFEGTAPIAPKIVNDNNREELLRD
jgi:hypothetical protein